MSKPASVKSWANPKFMVYKTDETILRLSKLLSTSAGINASLSTLAYGLYIAAYLDVNSPTRAKIIEILSRFIGRSAAKTVPVAVNPAVPVSKYAPYIGLVNDTRFALRLTGLIPMYLGARNLLYNPPKDKIVRWLRQIQMVNYILFQIFENLWFLSTKGLISATTLNRLGGSQKLMLHSCRPWLIAILCDFLRLGREAQLAKRHTRSGEKQLSVEEEQAAKDKWYSDLFVSMSWLPMAIHYSVAGGIGMNVGMVGMSGVLAGSGNIQRLWAATKA